MAAVVQQIWREIVRSNDTSTTTATTLSVVLPAAPTPGNLLVVYGVGRDSAGTVLPVVTLEGSGGQVVSMLDAPSPMELFNLRLGWREVESGDPTGWRVNFDRSCHSGKIGVVEFSGVPTPVLDKFATYGSGSGTSTSVATGSTGVLTSADGLWLSVGINRQASMTTWTQGSGGAELFANSANHDNTSAGGTNTTNPRDHAQVWSGVAWANLANTNALNITWTMVGAAATRMGATVAVFIAGGAPPSGPVGAQIFMVT